MYCVQNRCVYCNRCPRLPSPYDSQCVPFPSLRARSVHSGTPSFPAHSSSFDNWKSLTVDERRKPERYYQSAAAENALIDTAMVLCPGSRRCSRWRSATEGKEGRNWDVSWVEENIGWKDGVKFRKSASVWELCVFLSFRGTEADRTEGDKKRKDQRQMLISKPSESPN